jgi:hypothetical protein
MKECLELPFFHDGVDLTLRKIGNGNWLPYSGWFPWWCTGVFQVWLGRKSPTLLLQAPSHGISVVYARFKLTQHFATLFAHNNKSHQGRDTGWGTGWSGLSKAHSGLVSIMKAQFPKKAVACHVGISRHSRATPWVCVIEMNLLGQVGSLSSAIQLWVAALEQFSWTICVCLLGLCIPSGWSLLGLPVVSWRSWAYLSDLRVCAKVWEWEVCKVALVRVTSAQHSWLGWVIPKLPEFSHLWFYMVVISCLVFSLFCF